VRHGFKAQSERRAASARVALGLRPNTPLDPWQYAKHLNVTVLDFEALRLSKQSYRQLTMSDPDSWSAMTIQLNEKFAIVINPVHARTRQRSDLMHELAHIELLHSPARVEVSQTGLLLLSDYSDEQEQEADWFGATLLVPRDGLVRLRVARKTPVEIAAHFGVSEQLCQWRIHTTGVDAQLRLARR
jgi:Zn-dependent peptidase ImmA (M78 family)